MSSRRNDPFMKRPYGHPVPSIVVRVWLPDRPGALGQVASRIGSVRGDVVGIDILERGGGRAIDELVVELPSSDLVPLLVQEISQVDGVDVEDVRPLDSSRLDALETADVLVGASSIDDLLVALCEHGAVLLGAAWAAVVQPISAEIIGSSGIVPSAAWLAAFVEGSRVVVACTQDAGDVVWAPLPGSGLALVCGRDGGRFRARERHQAAALARIVDTRVRELETRLTGSFPAA
jgi:hypothetical protein